MTMVKKKIIKNTNNIFIGNIHNTRKLTLSSAQEKVYG